MHVRILSFVVFFVSCGLGVVACGHKPVTHPGQASTPTPLPVTNSITVSPEGEDARGKTPISPVPLPSFTPTLVNLPSLSPTPVRLPFYPSARDAEVFPTPVDTPQVEPDPSYMLAFETQRNGNDDIYIVQADGSEEAQLTTNEDSDRDPSWSPDGRSLVFTSYHDDNLEVCTIDIQSKHQRNLTNHPAHDYAPIWSPDGMHIAFFSGRDGAENVYVMEADGSQVVKLTEDDTRKSHLTWSPDGTHLAYTAEEPGTIIYIASLADGATTRLVEGYYPAWSPDGTRIAFVDIRDSHASIYTITADGVYLQQVTNEGLPGPPAWSPDSTHIAFGCTFSNYLRIYYGVYLVKADGSTFPVELTDASFSEIPISWSPDGKYLAYTLPPGYASKAIDGTMYLLRADGTAKQELMRGWRPVWQPQP